MAGNKLYAEVTAEIRFTAKQDDAERLYAHFTARRGIAVVKKLTRGTVRGTTWLFTVTYRVHGGWRSDFQRKLEYDAADTGVRVSDIDIQVTRNEIPGECPRKDCSPCGYAVDPSKRFEPLPERKPRKKPNTVVEAEAPIKKRKFFNF